MLLLFLQFALLAVGLVVVAFLLWIWSNRAACLPAGIPSIPGHLPILGHTLTVGKNADQFWSFLRESSLQFAPLATWSLTMLSTPLFVYIQGEANVKYVLKDNFENYKLPSGRTEVFGELFGSGIFASNGESWRIQRKAASHIFSFRQLNDHMTHIIVKHTHTLIQVLTAAMESNQPIDMQRMFFRLTMDSFVEWAFGENLHSLTQEHVPFADSFDRLQYLLTQRLLSPVWKLKKLVGIGSEGEIKKHLKVLDDFAEKTITRRRAVFESLSEGSGLEAGSSLVSWFIREKRKTGGTLSNQELRDILINFMVAGRDTTACLLSWFVYELTQHPEEEEKIVHEIKTALSDPSVQDGEVKDKYQAAVRALPYLEAALLETLRLHPSVPADDRECVNDDTLPDGSKIPKGTIIQLLPYMSGRNSALWGADCLEYKPSRWLIPDSQVPVRDAYNQYFFPAFNAGPRICLGKTLAITEAKLAMTMLLEKFKFCLVPGQLPIKYVVTITLNIKNGLRCTIQQRV